jgi:PhzF family phenazine biosynthesis protein
MVISSVVNIISTLHDLDYNTSLYELQWNCRVEVHARFFAPTYGIPEDPATGSANGALGAYLVHHASASSALRRAVEVTEPTTYIVSEQGAEINRPSTLYVELALSPVEGVDSAGEETTAVRVGGQVVLVAEGVVRFKGDSGDRCARADRTNRVALRLPRESCALTR